MILDVSAAALCRQKEIVMSETHQKTEPQVGGTASKPADTPLTPWTIPVQHRQPAVIWLIVLLIALQLVFGGLAAFQIWKFIDLGERIERLEHLTNSRGG